MAVRLCEGGFWLQLGWAMHADVNTHGTCTHYCMFIWSAIFNLEPVLVHAGRRDRQWQNWGTCLCAAHAFAYCASLMLSMMPSQLVPCTPSAPLCPSWLSHSLLLLFGLPHAGLCPAGAPDSA